MIYIVITLSVMTVCLLVKWHTLTNKLKFIKGQKDCLYTEKVKIEEEFIAYNKKAYTIISNLETNISELEKNKNVFNLDKDIKPGMIIETVNNKILLTGKDELDNIWIVNTEDSKNYCYANSSFRDSVKSNFGEISVIRDSIYDGCNLIEKGVVVWVNNEVNPVVGKMYGSLIKESSNSSDDDNESANKAIDNYLKNNKK